MCIRDRSIGVGAANMVTAALTATINNIPLLLFPSDYFATRQPDPVLQQLEVQMCIRDSGQTNAVAVYGVSDLERLTHAVDAPLLVADRLEGQLDTVRLGNVGEFVQHLHRVVENFLLVSGADLIGDSRHHDDIRIADLLCHLAAEGEQLYELFPLLDVYKRQVL